MCAFSPDMFQVCSAHMSVLQPHKMTSVALDARLQALVDDNAAQAHRNVLEAQPEWSAMQA